jgi:hypothetical protein
MEKLKNLPINPQELLMKLIEEKIFPLEVKLTIQSFKEADITIRDKAYHAKYYKAKDGSLIIQLKPVEEKK